MLWYIDNYSTTIRKYGPPKLIALLSSMETRRFVVPQWANDEGKKKIIRTVLVCTESIGRLKEDEP